jgi:hypothetical protein
MLFALTTFLLSLFYQGPELFSHFSNYITGKMTLESEFDFRQEQHFFLFLGVQTGSGIIQPPIR